MRNPSSHKTSNLHLWDCMHILTKNTYIPDRKVLVAQSCPTLCDPMNTAHQASLSMDSPDKSTGVDCHLLLQGIILTHRSDPGLLHQTLPLLYQLSLCNIQILSCHFDNFHSIFPRSRLHLHNHFLCSFKRTLHLFKFYWDCSNWVTPSDLTSKSSSTTYFLH